MRTPSVTSVLALDAGAETVSHRVDERLTPHVSSYWTLTVVTPPVRVRVIPDGCVDLVFDLDLAEALVAGVSEHPFEGVHERPTRLLGVSLLPGVAAPLLDTPLTALGPRWQPLGSVIGPIAGTLARALHDARDMELQIALVEAFLLARLGRVDVRVERALSAIAETDGREAIDSLGRRSGTSARNLTRLFRDYVGMAPKRFARLVRAQAAVRRLADCPALELVHSGFRRDLLRCGAENMTSIEASNVAVIRTYLAALGRGAVGEELASFFTPDAVQVELPNQLNRSGGQSNLSALLERAERGRALLRSQTYEIRSELACEHRVAIEAIWLGTLAVPLGNLPAGSVMKAHFAMFFELSGGRITSQRNYDCFEPW
jgi:AraC-like DNA-binding protein/ketosteroid isomerase-like protein